MFNKIIHSLLFASLMFVSSVSWAFEYFLVNQATPVYLSPDNAQGVITQLYKGHVLLQIEQQGSWSQVFFLSSQKQPLKGWLLTSSIDQLENRTPDKQVSSTGNYVVTVDKLRVRKGPGTQYDVVGQLVENQIVRHIQSENGWFKIDFQKPSGNTKQAWVLAKFLQMTVSDTQTVSTQVEASPNPGQDNNLGLYRVNASRVNFREGPETSFPVVGQLHSNQVVDVVDKAQGWVKISYDLLGKRVSGWMSETYLDKK